MTNLNKGLRLGGVFASQTIDKSGEIIDIKGLDISALNSGESYLNSEHHNNNFSNYLGRIVHAKKIFKYEDCESEHEKKCFKESGEVPLVYGIAELFNDEGHSEAISAASIVNHFKKRNLPIAARFSIEGDTLDRDNASIKRAVAKRVALTMSPCNDTCVSDIIPELTKSEQAVYEKMANEVSKNILCKGSYGTVDVFNVEKNTINIKNSLDIFEQELNEKKQILSKSKNKLNAAKLFSYNFLINDYGD